MVELAALGVTYAGVDRRWLSDDLYAALRSAGLRIGVWTVNERDEIRKFVAMGVDFITSDRPDVVRRIVPR